MYPQVPPDPGIPARQYEEAVSLMREGHYAEALPILSRLDLLRASPPIALTRGRCLVALGRYVEAAHAFASVEILSDGSRWALLRDDAAREKDAARAKIAKLVIDAGGYEGVTVLVDGTAAAFGTALHDPGRAVVLLTRAGWTEREEIDLAPGETRHIVFHYPGPEDRPHRVPWYAWVTGGGALAGLGAFGGIELVAAHDDRRSLQTPAVVALSTAVVLAVTTAVIFTTSGR